MVDFHKAIRALYSNVTVVNGNNDSYKAWDKDGNEVEIDRSKVDAWIDPNEYKDKRQVEYPDIGDQLDALYHDIDDGKLGADAKTGTWYTAVKAVKDEFPKN